MTQKLTVSDHAALRWLERGVGLDMGQLKRCIADALDNAFQAACKLGVSNYLILLDGQVYIVRDGTLTTVVPNDGRHQHLLDPLHAKPKEGPRT